MIESLFNLINIPPVTALHWILVISITLFLIDIFCQTEVISWVALLIFATYLTLYLDVIIDIPVQWSHFAFLGILILEFSFYYAIWVKIARPFIKKFILHEAPKEREERAKGKIVTLRIIDSKHFVYFEGELCSAILLDAYLAPKDRDQVVIVGEDDGKFVVEPIL